MQESIVFLVRVQCRRKESSRSLSHLLMSFLSYTFTNLRTLRNCLETMTTSAARACNIEMRKAPSVQRPGT